MTDDTNTRMESRINDHGERIRSLEIDRGAALERHASLMAILTDLKNSFNALILKIEQGYVTKESLTILTKDGKYKSLWGGLIGAILTFFILGAIGLFLPFKPY